VGVKRTRRRRGGNDANDPKVDIGPSLALPSFAQPRFGFVLCPCGDPYPVSHPYPRATLIVGNEPPKLVNAPLVTPQAHDILAERMIEIVQRVGAASDAVLGL
jgi:hypothetical protein